MRIFCSLICLVFELVCDFFEALIKGIIRNASIENFAVVCVVVLVPVTGYLVYKECQYHDAKTIDIGFDVSNGLFYGEFDRRIHADKVLWIIIPTPDGKGEKILKHVESPPEWEKAMDEYLDQSKYRLKFYSSFSQPPRKWVGN